MTFRKSILDCLIAMIRKDIRAITSYSCWMENGGNLEAALYLTVGGKDEARFINSLQDMTRKLESRNYLGFHFRSRVYGSDNHMSVVTPAVWAGLLWVFGGE